MVHMTYRRQDDNNDLKRARSFRVDARLVVCFPGGSDTVRVMLEFGLTGGIGSGKSTVSALLSERGAIIIDADAIVRDLQRPDELVFDAMVAQWGSTIVSDDGTLDRAAVANIVFSDSAELDRLNGIVHPAVADETARRLDAVTDPSAIVVHDIPLLVLPGGELLTSRDHTLWAGIVVVDTPETLAVERVVASRGMEPEAVKARMATQASRDDRRSVASFVIDNAGTLDDLHEEVERCWTWMQSQARGVEHNQPPANRPSHRPGRTPGLGEQGLAESSGAEDADAAHIENAGLAEPSGAEDTGEQ